MPMTFKCATFIVVTNLKLTALLEKAKNENASAAIISDIRAKLDALEPRTAEANNITIARSDAEFASLAKKVKAQTNKIDAAIADFSKINDALTAAGKLITQITQLLALVP
jgi:phage host-nuclease inhibitor protein Gam